MHFKKLSSKSYKVSRSKHMHMFATEPSALQLKNFCNFYSKTYQCIRTHPREEIFGGNSFFKKYSLRTQNYLFCRFAIPFLCNYLISSKCIWIYHKYIEKKNANEKAVLSSQMYTLKLHVGVRIFFLLLLKICDTFISPWIEYGVNAYISL